MKKFIVLAALGIAIFSSGCASRRPRLNVRTYPAPSAPEALPQSLEDKRVFYWEHKASKFGRYHYLGRSPMKPHLQQGTGNEILAAMKVPAATVDELPTDPNGWILAYNEALAKALGLGVEGEDESLKPPDALMWAQKVKPARRTDELQLGFRKGRWTIGQVQTDLGEVLKVLEMEGRSDLGDRVRKGQRQLSFAKWPLYGGAGGLIGCAALAYVMLLTYTVTWGNNAPPENAGTIYGVTFVGSGLLMGGGFLGRKRGIDNITAALYEFNRSLKNPQNSPAKP